MKRPKTYDEELAELEMIAKTVKKSKGGGVREEGREGGREGKLGGTEGREGGREGRRGRRDRGKGS